MTMSEKFDRDWRQWAGFIRPAEEDLRWQAIPWRSSLYSAVCEAQRLDRPILLWAMNGHPLACT